MCELEDSQDRPRLVNVDLLESFSESAMMKIENKLIKTKG